MPARFTSSEAQLKRARRALLDARSKLERELETLRAWLKTERDGSRGELRRPNRSTRSRLRRRLKRIKTHLKRIRRAVARYHQSDRDQSRSREATRLREVVWTLLHRERELYRVVDGYLCLHATRRADLAEVYQAIGESAEASHQRKFERACRVGWLSASQVDSPVDSQVDSQLESSPDSP